MLDNKKIGRHIQWLRKEAGWTQVELSERLGISHQAVSKWENGESLPDLEVLLQLARAFGLSVEELLLADTGSAAQKEAAPLHSSGKVDGDLLWAEVLNVIREKLSPPSYDTWFKETTGTVDGDTLVVTCPNRFSAEWVFSRYSFLIEQALDEVQGTSNTKLRFQSLANDDSVPTGRSERAELSLEDF
ncbi:helix-turn-helix domain-containing protein [Gorillibacterium sp. CAU 1737]|uniref:helix-turn-helix transcriptional regulator n=1 Tax=Gorillibacterium sp. CAU 1737 TaxID=3140362 RepID=UPI003260FE61